MVQQRSDRSYGIIPVRKVQEEWEFLLVKHLGGHWSFPKGHPEGDESPKQAATRELLEETALQVKQFFPKYPFKEEYSFFHNKEKINKTVLYYLAEVQGEAKLQEEELLDLRWLAYSESCQQLSFPRSVQICRQAHQFLIQYSEAEKIKTINF